MKQTLRLTQISAILLLLPLLWLSGPVLGEPVSLAEQEKSTGPAGALAPLAQYLESDQEMAFISWKPVDFQKAVQAKFTTVWLGIGGFLQMTDSERQAVLVRAQQAGLRTLGFIGGDPEWVNPSRPEQPAFAVDEYRRLTGVLDAFIQRNPGNLKFAFATDIEPYTAAWWDGDLALYSTLIGKISVPVQEFNLKHRDRMKAGETFLTRFEPFWWRNGHVTENGKVIRGLQDTSGSNVASMTYRDQASSILDVSESIRARAQEMGKHGMRFLLGAETKPAGSGIPATITFDGELSALASSPDGVYTFANRNGEGILQLQPSGQTYQIVRGILPLDAGTFQSAAFLNGDLLEIVYSIPQGTGLPTSEERLYYFIGTQTLLNAETFVHARLSPDRKTLYYVIQTQTHPATGQFYPKPAFFLVKYAAESGNREYLQLPGRGESYSLGSFELEAVSPSGNYLLVRRGAEGLLIDLKNFTQAPRFLPGAPALDADLASSARFIDDQTLEGTYDYRLRVNSPGVPVEKKLYSIPAPVQPLTRAEQRTELREIKAVAKTSGIQEAVAVGESHGLKISALSSTKNAFVLGLGGDRLALISLSGKNLRARDLRLRGFDPSAEVVFITRSLIKVTTSSGRVYYVKI